MSTTDGATLFLSEHADDTAGLSTIFLVTQDVEVIAAALGVQALVMPWGDRECETFDPDGNKIRVSQLAESG